MAKKEIRPELVPFIELNAEEKALGEKMPWKRDLLIHKQFPSVARLNWRQALSQDDTLWGKLLKDLLDPKIIAGEDQRRTKERLRQMTGNDYSHLPFTDAFRTLAGSRSIRHLATKLKLGQHIIFDLKSGAKQPDIKMLEQIARGFGKDPSYFVEYRISYILGALGDQMESAPEMSVDLYRKIRKKRST